MNINGANFHPGYNVGYGSCQPKADGKIFCQPVQNFRIDGGAVNLYSQKVSIDWPEFRPQNPIFSGPRVKQDTTDVYMAPLPNYNFDDCVFTGDAYAQVQGLMPGFGMLGGMDYGFGAKY